MEDEALDRATDALLTALREGQDPEPAVSVLRRGDVDRIEARMEVLARDVRWEARAAAAAVLRFLTGPSGTRPEGAIARARARRLTTWLAREEDPRALAEMLAAFVDLREELDPAEVCALALPFASHASAEVRHVSVVVLSGIDRDEAIDALVRASRDDDAPVRDAACFGLGHLLGSPTAPGGIVDTPPIREALAARLADDDVEAREEAATGLALRGDPRGIAAVEALLARFDEEGVTTRVLATAAEAPHPSYVPHLEAIVRELPHLREATLALDECRAAVPRPFCRGPRLHAACDCFRGLPGLPRR